MSEVEKVEKVEKKKEKKVLTPERLEQLAKARHRALQIRQAGASLKQEQKEMADAALEEKLERERQLNDAVKKSLIPNTIDHSLLPVPRYTNTIIPNLIEEEEEEEEQPVIIKKKTKKPPKTKVIIEQSSDDEDEFQSNEHVIFVKRKSKNDSIKKVPATTPVPPNTPEPYYAPPPTPRKPQPEFTNFVDLMANNGGFVNRRKYY
jgi:DNA polymerase IIIc chi subunit